WCSTRATLTPLPPARARPVGTRWLVPIRSSSSVYVMSIAGFVVTQRMGASGVASAVDATLRASALLTCRASSAGSIPLDLDGSIIACEASVDTPRGLASFEQRFEDGRMGMASTRLERRAG